MLANRQRGWIRKCLDSCDDGFVVHARLSMLGRG
jgi:hypothetical protein